MKARHKLLIVLAVIVLCVILLAVAFEFLSFAEFEVEGTVTDESGSPLPDAEVSLGNLTAKTDQSGKYSLKIPQSMLQSVLDLQVRAPGFAPGVEKVKPSGSKCSCNTTLTRLPVVVEGRVTDESGKPIAGAGVAFSNYTTTTGLNGSYTLEIPMGLHPTTAGAQGFETFRDQFNATAEDCFPDNGTEPRIAYNITLIRSTPIQNLPSNGTLPLNSSSCVCTQTRIGVDGSVPGDPTPLFLIRNISGTPYLRQLVGELYEDGTWQLLENASVAEYCGGKLESTVQGFSSSESREFEIQPYVSFGGFVPSTLNTNEVILNSSLTYYVEQQLFFSSYTFSNSYNVSHTLFSFSEEVLNTANATRDARYLSVPLSLKEKLESLALNITSGIDSDFQKLTAIADYLRSNCRYDENYTQAPMGVDPVDWFIFYNKRGVCIHFNSAFVLLARSIGLPARLCAGYLVNPSAPFQEVLGKQRHAYAEVPFYNLGWITFDATGAGPCGCSSKEARVEIHYPKTGAFISGSRITVSGLATSLYKNAEVVMNSSDFSLTHWDDVENTFVFDNTSLCMDGNLTLTVSASDYAGNNGSDTVTFTIDNTKPKVAINHPADDTHIPDLIVWVNGTVDELNRGEAEPVINDSRFVLRYWNSSSGDFSFSNAETLTGETSVTVSFRDLAGNEGSDTVTFHADWQPPVRIATRTNITNCSSVAVKGSVFFVDGTVFDVDGNRLTGLDVLVFITKDKNQTGTLCGQGRVVDGFFHITCNVSKDTNVGDYQVVAHTLPTQTYEESQSDPGIKIMAETMLSFIIPEKVIMGRSFTVNATLKEKLAEKPVANETLLLFIGDMNCSLLTGENGFAVSACSLWTPGNYTALLVYPGSENYLNTTSARTIRALDITISPTTNATLVRSEGALLCGNVHAEELPLDSEPLDISLDGEPIAQAQTDAGGHFNVSYSVPSDQTLGPAALSYALQRYPRNATQTIKIKAKTNLTSTAPTGIYSGDLLNMTATLKDDLQQPIRDADVELRCSFPQNVTSATNTTGDGGTAEFMNMTFPNSFTGNLSYVAGFNGTDYYLPSSDSGIIHVAARPFDYTRLWLLIATVFPATVTPIALFLFWRKRRKNPETGTGNAPPENVPDTPPNKKAKLGVEFPQIRAPFPNVWGVNESLTIQFKLEDEFGQPVSNVNLVSDIDAADETSFTTGKGGDAETVRVFENKGKRIINARCIYGSNGEQAEAQSEVRIVDYREEVVDLFNSLFKSLKAEYPKVLEEMTPREALAVIQQKIPDSKRKPLELIVLTFEVADYSLHPITRKEYEQVYLAIKEFEA